MTPLRVHCDVCHAANPRKHRKVNPDSRSWAYQYALLCPTCARRRGYEEIPDRFLFGPSGALKIP